CIAESDIFSQALIHQLATPEASSAERESAMVALNCATYDLIRACTQDYSNGVALKLRSQANLDPSFILSICSDKPRSIFIVRDFISWAVSRWRAFGFSTELNIEHYTQALKALHWLRDKTDLLVINYRDLASGNPLIYSELARFLGVRQQITSEDIASV